MRRHNFDVACLTLAEHFLGSQYLRSDANDLAQSIQQAVEDWFETKDLREQPCLSPAEQKAQGERCGCLGADDYCTCQNVPDRETRAARAWQEKHGEAG